MIRYFDCPFEIKSDSITEQGIFEGYGSTFGGKPDSYGDIINKGAFKETLERGGRNKTGIKMLWQHDSKQPIGVWNQIAEDVRGLKVVGQLALDVQQGKEAYVLMKMRALDGLSIGWDILRKEDGEPEDDAFEIKEDKKRKIRYLKRLELWEISPVTFMANTSATITQVKSAIEESKTIREFENALRDAGLSKSASEYIASLCKPILEKKWNENMFNILETVRKLNKQIGG